MNDHALLALLIVALAVAGIFMSLRMDEHEKRIAQLEQAEGTSIHRVQWRSAKKRQPWWRRVIEKVSKW